MNTLDLDGYRTGTPTAQEVIDHTRAADFDACVSAWQARAYGLSLFVIADPRPDRVRWHLWIPPEARAAGQSVPSSRFVEVFPPANGIDDWSFRPVDPNTWAPLPWSSIEHNASRGREHHARNLREWEARHLAVEVAPC